MGTGGTLRNLATIDRSRHRYPISQLHGYVLSLEGLHGVVSHLATTREKRRNEIEGSSAERADSIVGGAVAIETFMEFVRAKRILVSGQGVREGMALTLLKMDVGSTEEVKEASLASLTLRFDSWHPEAALFRAIEPHADPRIQEALNRGARVLDIGRSLEFFNRHEHVADMLLATELNGFTHEELALMSGLVRLAGNRHADPRRLRPLIADADGARLDRAAVILALADEIERRCPHGRTIAVSCEIGRDVKVSVPLLPTWRTRDLGQRFERAFRKPLSVRPG